MNQKKDEINTLAEANAYLNSLPTSEQLQKWKLQRKRKLEKARDKRDESNAGIPNPNAMNQHYDEHGDLKDEAKPPHWKEALAKAHKAPAGERAYNSFPEQFINKPNPNPKKGKQSNKMRKIKELETAGYRVDKDDYIMGYDKIRVLINGRVEIEETGERMKMHEFIRDYC